MCSTSKSDTDISVPERRLPCQSAPSVAREVEGLEELARLYEDVRELARRSVVGHWPERGGHDSYAEVDIRRLILG
jgi:hypothetical protein